MSARDEATPQQYVSAFELFGDGRAVLADLVRLFGGALKREYVADRYGAAFWLRMAPELVAMRLLGATRRDADGLRLTRRGMYCWVLMMAEFFNSVNDVREQMREHIRAELDSWNEEARVPVSEIGRLGA